MKINMRDTENWIPKEIFEAYCGERSNSLLVYYDKAVSKKSMNLLSLNWMAILVLPAWLGYRKQWSALITITIIFVMIPFLEAILSIPISNAGILGGLLVLGLLGNSIILINAQRDFGKLKEKGIDHDTVKRQLINKVSPSVKYAFVGLFVYIFCSVGAAIIADLIFGLPY